MSEEQAQQLLYQMQMLEGYLADITHREQTLLNIFKEAISAVDSIKGFKQSPVSDSLMPIGMGTFVKTKISSNDKLVVNIGAGIAMEKDVDSTLNYLEARIKEVEMALQEASNNKHNVAQRIEQGKQQMNMLMKTAKQSQK